MRFNGTLVLFLTILGCSSNDVSSENVATGSDWTHALARNPSAFNDLMQASEKTAWVHVHQHQYSLAYQAFSKTRTPSNEVGRTRSAQAVTRHYRTLSRITEWVAQRYFTEVSASPEHTLTKTGHKMMAYAASCKTTDSTTLDALVARTQAPMFQETSASGMGILWFDPCVYRDFERLWQRRTDEAAKGAEALPAGLAWSLFSPTPITEDNNLLLSDQINAFEQEMADLTRHATTQGGALLQELSIPKQLRHRLYRIRAERALQNQQYSEATRLALQSFAPGQPVGPLVSPQSLLILAESQIKQQRYRDALQTLHILSGGTLHMRVVLEWLGDLSVIKDIDREGDSKEN